VRSQAFHPNRIAKTGSMLKDFATKINGSYPRQSSPLAQGLRRLATDTGIGILVGIANVGFSLTIAGVPDADSGQAAFSGSLRWPLRTRCTL